MSDENSTLKVVDKSHVDAEFAAIHKDMKALKEQMETDKTATGLALEQRKDDEQKYVKEMAQIVENMGKLEADVKSAKKAAAMVHGRQGLVKEIDPIMGGFREKRGTEEDFKDFDPGTKPTLKHLVDGIILPNGEEYSPNHDRIKQLQDLNDALLVLDVMLSEGPNGQAYRAAGGIRATRLFKQFTYLADVIQKADDDLMDTIDTANWVPTHFTSNVWFKVKIGLPELAMFPEITMPGKTFDLPIDMTDTEGILQPEVTTVSGASPFADLNVQRLDDQKTTLTAQKCRARVLTSREVEEDAVVALMSLIQSQIVRMLQEAIADALSNGDTDGSPLDTDGTHFGKANPPVAPDFRVAWDGLRRIVRDQSAPKNTRVDNSNADATVQALRDVRSTMGEYGVTPSDLAWLFGIFGYVQLLNDAQVVTVEKFGPQATVKTGALASVDGTSIIVSRRIPENLNASGDIDNLTTDRTTALCVNVRSFIMGNRRRITSGSDTYGATDTRDTFVFWRGDFKRLHPATEPAVGELYNLRAA